MSIRKNNKPSQHTITSINTPLKKYDWESPRKIFHMSIGFVAIAGYLFRLLPSNVFRFLLAFFLVALVADFARSWWPKFNFVYVSLLGFLMRAEEKRNSRLNGTVYYLLGTVIVTGIFPIDIAVLSICYLSWCDPVASIAGRLCGHLTPRLGKKKSLAGTLAATFVGCLVTFVFWTFVAFRNEDASWNPETGISIQWLSLWGGIIAGLSELVDVYGIDDNAVIPAVSGTAMWILLKMR